MPWPTNTRSPRTAAANNDIAKDLGHLLLAEFGRQEGTLLNLRRAPEQQQKNWAATDAARAASTARSSPECT